MAGINFDMMDDFILCIPTYVARVSENLMIHQFISEPCFTQTIYFYVTN